MGIYDATRPLVGHRIALFLEEYGPTLAIGLAPVVLFILWVVLAHPHFVEDGGPGDGCSAETTRYC